MFWSKHHFVAWISALQWLVNIHIIKKKKATHKFGSQNMRTFYSKHTCFLFGHIKVKKMQHLQNLWGGDLARNMKVLLVLKIVTSINHHLYLWLRF